AVSCGAAVAASFFAAGGFGDISACARAPETISALVGAEIISVLSICGLRSCLFRQGIEVFLAREQLASTVMRSVHWEPGRRCCEGICALQARRTSPHWRPGMAEANRGCRDGTLIAGKGPRALTTD